METVKQKSIWPWQKLEKILVVLFFLTFTLNIRKVFLTPYSFLNGGFNEYTTMNLSWADVLMILTIIIYTIKYIISQYIGSPASDNKEYHNNSIKSIFISHNVSRETLFLLIFLVWIGLSIFWSQYQPIAIYRFLTLLELILFAYLAIKALKSKKWLKIAIYALIFNGLVQSVIGIAQFIQNKSLGLHILGESIIGPNINGVAKIVINGEKHIRAYGTFPHPNIMAGFLIIPILIILSELITKKSSFFLGKGLEKDLKNVSRETLLNFLPSWFLYISGMIIMLGFVLTFSRSAFLGLFVGFLVYLIGVAKIIQRFSSDSDSNKSCKHLILIFISVALFLLVLLASKYTSFFSSQSLEERNLYKIVSYETISNYTFKGIGIGQFVLSEYSRWPNLESWQYQPVHDIFLLVFSELGIIGFSLLALFLVFKLWKGYFCYIRYGDSLKLTDCIFYCIIFSFLAISVFDHYFWDIKTGMLVFVLPLILTATIENFGD